MKGIVISSGICPNCGLFSRYIAIAYKDKSEESFQSCSNCLIKMLNKIFETKFDNLNTLLTLALQEFGRDEN